MAHKNFIVMLVLLLVFQPIATAFAGCVQKNTSEHTDHGEKHFNNTHALHQPANINFSDEEKHKTGCFTDCHCAGMCLHACHAPSIIVIETIIIPEKPYSSYLFAQHFSLTDYKVRLLRPPAFIS